MGKGTDKLYITHSEWASEDAYSASVGSGLAKSKVADTTFKRLPFNFCAVSLQPFKNPVCTADGTIFDIENITAWLKDHSTDPVTGQSLKKEDLIELKFARNDEGDMVDPVTFKVFTNNTHLVAVKNTGNVYSYDTVERLNIKAKMWRDLVSDEAFSRKDIITLQDPQNLESRNLSSFKYVKEGINTLAPEQAQERIATVNRSALGNAASVLTPKTNPTSGPKVGKYLPSQQKTQANPSPSNPTKQISTKPPLPPSQSSKIHQASKQTSHHTTGATAASFTSTGLTPSTTSALATLSDEEYLLRKPRLITQPGYVRLTIPPHGTLTLELHPEFAPRAVWNFLQLAKRGYYNDCTFHRNIAGFMLQGGDPMGTGRGGESCWGKNKPFADEIEGGARSHNARGVLSMANKGKDTNTSQFFITYRPCRHLDRKHTIFGRVVFDDKSNGQPSNKALDTIEKVPVSEGDKRPLEPLFMTDVTVLVDPFEEFLQKRAEAEKKVAEEEEETKRLGGRADDRLTWTGKRVRGAGDRGGGDDDDAVVTVGRYISSNGATGKGEEEDGLEEWERGETEPVKKKVKAGGGFGNFDNW